MGLVEVCLPPTHEMPEPAVPYVCTHHASGRRELLMRLPDAKNRVICHGTRMTASCTGRPGRQAPPPPFLPLTRISARRLSPPRRKRPLLHRPAPLRAPCFIFLSPYSPPHSSTPSPSTYSTAAGVAGCDKKCGKEATCQVLSQFHRELGPRGVAAAAAYSNSASHPRNAYPGLATRRELPTSSGPTKSVLHFSLSTGLVRRHGEL